MFEGTTEQYENLRLKHIEDARISKAQDALTEIIIQYLKVADLRYSHVKSVFNVVLNRVYDKEAEQKR